MKLKNKIISLAVCLSFCLVALFNAVYFSDKNIKTHQTIMNNSDIDYMSLLEDFDEKELVVEEDKVKLDATQYLDEDFFSELDNLSYNDEVVPNSYIDYSFDIDGVSSLIIVTISFYENNELVSVETMKGVPFTNEEGKLDAIFNDEGEVVYLSDFADIDEFQNCGLFSKLKKAVKKVTKAVTETVKVAAVAVVGGAVLAGVAVGVTALAYATGGASLPATLPAAMSTLGWATAGLMTIVGSVGVGTAIIDQGFNAMPEEYSRGDINSEPIKEVSRDGVKSEALREYIKETQKMEMNDIIVDEIKVEGTKLIIKGETKTGAIKEITVDKGSLVPDKSFSSFDQLKKHLGSAGEGKAWHHIVEQSQVGKNGITAEDVNNVNNVIAIPHGKGTVHAEISGHYSSKPNFTNGLTVREWLAQNMNFEEQFKYGMDYLKQFGEVVATEEGWKFFPFEK